jgi:hypothetical protein
MELFSKAVDIISCWEGGTSVRDFVPFLGGLITSNLNSIPLRRDGIHFARSLAISATNLFPFVADFTPCAMDFIPFVLKVITAVSDHTYFAAESRSLALT